MHRLLANAFQFIYCESSDSQRLAVLSVSQSMFCYLAPHICEAAALSSKGFLIDGYDEQREQAIRRLQKPDMFAPFELRAAEFRLLLKHSKGTMTFLHHLSLPVNGVTDDDISRLVATRPQHLEFLAVNYCHAIKPSSLTPLFRDCSRLLTSVDFSHFHLTDRDIMAFADCWSVTHQVRRLDLRSTDVSDRSIVHVVTKIGRRLTYLNLSETKITDFSVAAVSQHCPVLAALLLEQNNRQAITDASLRAISAANMAKDSLVCLVLTQSSVSDVGVNLIADHCTYGLSRLDMGNMSTPQVTVGSMHRLAQSRATVYLRSLNLGGFRCNTNDMDSIVTMFSVHCPNLERLNLFMTSLSSVALISIATHLAETLTFLDVLDCGCLGDDGVEAVLNSCERLSHLNIGGCVSTHLVFGNVNYVRYSSDILRALLTTNAPLTELTLNSGSVEFDHEDVIAFARKFGDTMRALNLSGVQFEEDSDRTLLRRSMKSLRSFKA